MTSPRAIATAAVFALFALSFAWYLWLAPSHVLPAWFAASLHALLMLPAVLLLLLRRPSALFWGGVGALFAFCHGVMEAWTAADARVLGLVEVVLSLAIIFGSSWDGMRKRLAKKRGV